MNREPASARTAELTESLQRRLYEEARLARWRRWLELGWQLPRSQLIGPVLPRER